MTRRTLGLPFYNLIFLVAPATGAGYGAVLGDVAGAITMVFFNPSDVDQADLNVDYWIPDSDDDRIVDVSLEKSDSSGDTRPWSECLSKLQTLKSLRPNLRVFADLSAIRGNMVLDGGAPLTNAIADLDSAGAQSFFSYLRTNHIGLSPQCYPIDSVDLYTFSKTLVSLYAAHCGGTPLYPIVCRRTIAPFNAAPGVFWTPAQWNAIEGAIRDAGAVNRTWWDGINSDAIAEQYRRLIADELVLSLTQRANRTRTKRGARA